MTTCSNCGAQGVTVHRTKPFGQPDAGWMCRPCIEKVGDPSVIDPEAERLANILSGEAGIGADLYDDSGRDPEAYARWLRTLSKPVFLEVMDEVTLSYRTTPPDQDDYCYKERAEACEAEYKRREAADPFYFNSDRD